jgi:hypothetical protein
LGGDVKFQNVNVNFLSSIVRFQNSIVHFLA